MTKIEVSAHKNNICSYTVHHHYTAPPSERVRPECSHQCDMPTPNLSGGLRFRGGFRRG